MTLHCIIHIYIYTQYTHAHTLHMFSWFLKFGVLPAKFTQSTIVPLVKVKCGDLSDIDNDNYRAIMISNAITKVFDFVLFDKLTSIHNFLMNINLDSKLSIVCLWSMYKCTKTHD